MLKWINKKRNQKGFTLIELVVVIAILGILAAIAIPRLSGARNDAAANADAASVRTIQSAISMAEAAGELNLVIEEGNTVDAASIKAAIIPKYIAEVPKTQTADTIGWSVTPIADSDAGVYTITIVPAAEAPDWANPQ